jgi:DNA-binding MarR family transcriptional regulator
MEALELIQLGRRLVRIGEQVLRGSGEAYTPPLGPRMVLHDVFDHPRSSVTNITRRTGLPQSYVSESIARLRDQGFVVTEVDPADRRRTLVRTNPEHLRSVARKGTASVDTALAEAVGERDPANAEVLANTLTDLARRLLHTAPGPVRRQLQQEQSASPARPNRAQSARRE